MSYLTWTQDNTSEYFIKCQLFLKIYETIATRRLGVFTGGQKGLKISIIIALPCVISLALNLVLKTSEGLIFSIFPSWGQFLVKITQIVIGTHWLAKFNL